MGLELPHYQVISLNPANKKTYDQSLSDFQTGIGAAVHATLETVQLIYCTRTALAKTVAPVQVFDGKIILVSEVYELCTKIHDILDITVSKLIDNTGHILVVHLILFLGSVMKFGLHSFTFFTILRTMFALMRFALMVTFTSHWFRLRNNLNWGCLRLSD